MVPNMRTSVIFLELRTKSIKKNPQGFEPFSVDNAILPLKFRKIPVLISGRLPSYRHPWKQRLGRGRCGSTSLLDRRCIGGEHSRLRELFRYSRPQSMSWQWRKPDVHTYDRGESRIPLTDLPCLCKWGFFTHFKTPTPRWRLHRQNHIKKYSNTWTERFFKFGLNYSPGFGMRSIFSPLVQCHLRFVLEMANCTDPSHRIWFISKRHCFATTYRSLTCLTYVHGIWDTGAGRGVDIFSPFCDYRKKFSKRLSVRHVLAMIKISIQIAAAALAAGVRKLQGIGVTGRILVANLPSSRGIPVRAYPV